VTFDTTLADQVNRVRGHLQQFSTVRQQTATFTSFAVSTIDPSITTGINLVTAGASRGLSGSALVEVGSELIAVDDFDSNTGKGTVPPWGRGVDGSPVAAHAGPLRATINPPWPTYQIAQTIVDATAALYPTLFSVQEVTVQSVNLETRYALPPTVDDVLWAGVHYTSDPSDTERRTTEFRVDASNAGGGVYFEVQQRSVLANYRLTCRGKPLLADPADLTSVWSTTGLPRTASDLPVLAAAMRLLLASEASRTQLYSAEQSDRSRLVQASSGTGASRRIEEMYKARLSQEQAALRQRFPIPVRRR
jgi:hypothetical protein